MNLFDLYATISLDSSGFERGINGALSSGNSFATRISSIFNGISSLGASAMKSVGVAAGAGVAALGGFVKSSVDTGMDFDKSMSQVAATMGYTTDQLADESSQQSREFQKLRKAAVEYGETTAFSSTEVSEALNYMALAGYDANTSISMLPNVLNLAAAGNMDLAYASDALTDSQTALGLSIDETETLANQWAKAASKTNTSVEQLAEATLTVGGTATYMKGGISELNTTLGILANNGIKGSEAGTHLRNMLLKLASPTEDGAKWLDKLGVKVFDTDGKMRSFAEIFPELDSAMSDLTEEQKLQALSDIFNTRDIASANALLNTTSEEWRSIATEIMDCDGAMEEMAKTQLDNLAGDITIFKSALDGLKITISDSVTPAFRKFVQEGTDGIGTIKKAFEKGGWEGALNAVSSMLGEMVTRFTKVIPNIVSVATSMMSQFLGALKSHIPELKTAANVILTNIISAFDELIPQLMEIVKEGIPTFIKYFLTFKEQMFDVGLQLIVAIVEGIGDNIDTILNSALAIVEKLVNGLIDNIPKLADAAVDIINGLAKFFRSHSDEIVELGIELVNALIEGAKAIIPALWNLFTSAIDGIFNALGEKFPAFSGLFEGLADIMPALVAAFTAFTVATKAQAVAQGILNTVMNANPIALVIAGVVALAGGIVTLVSKIINWGDNAKECGEALESWSSKINAFSNDVANCTPKLADLTAVTSEYGRTTSEIDDLISEAEQNVTDIIAQAASENRDLRQSEIEDIENYNARIAELEQEKMSIYKNAQQDIAIAIQSELELTQEEMAQYVANIQAAEEQTVSAIEKSYAAKANDINNYYREIGEYGSEAHQEEIRANQEAMAQEIADAKSYSAESYALLTQRAADAVKSDIEMWSQLDASTKAGRTQMMEQLDQMDADAINAFLELAAQTKAAGQDLDAETEQMISDFLTTFGTMPKKMQESGKDALLGFIGGYEDMFPDMEDLADKSMDDIVSTVRDALDINSPSRVFAEIGKLMAEGLGLGFGDANTSVNNSISGDLEDSVTSVSDYLTKELNSVGLKVGELTVQSITKGMNSNFNALQSMAKQAIDTITKTLNSMMNTFNEIGKNMANGVTQGFLSMRGTMESKVRSMMKSVVSAVKDEMQIHSPSRVFASIGENMALGLGVGWDDTIDRVNDTITGDMDYSGAISGAAASTSGNLTTTEQITTININIDGANISDSREMAETIAEKLQSLVDRRQAVWA